MSTASAFYTQTSLALAAYGNFSADIAPSVQELRRIGMAEAQATQFANNWTVVDQYSDITGLSATVFQDQSGKHYLAIRGTEPSLLDLTAGFILANGFPPQLNPQFQSLTSKIQEWTNSGVLPSTFTVSGHSLGGYLSSAVALEFGARVEAIYTYNAPGVDAGIGGVVELLRTTLGISNSGELTNLYNLRATSGFSPIANLGRQLTSPILIETEFSLDPFENHSIVPLTDSLAFYDLFAKLDPALNTTDPAVGMGKIIEILKAASSNPALSLETALDSLRKLFKDPVAPAPISTATDDREQYYRNLFDLQGRLPAGTLTIDSLVTTSATQLAGLAQGSEAIAYRYALREFNPFAVVGNNAIYNQHNLNGRLDLYVPATRAGTLTADWIKDRAGLLEAVLISNTNDTPNNALIPGSSDISTQYHYYMGGPERVLLADPTDHLPAGQQRIQVVMFADDASRALIGFDFALGDRLYGGRGTDFLEGRTGDDRLEGGSGLDLYNYNAFSGLFGSGNDGADTILDTDGKGVLRYTFTQSGFLSNTAQSTVVADASVRVSGLQWNSADGRFTFTRSQEDLLITFNTPAGAPAGGSLILKNFKDGDFGIRLWEARATPQTASTISGDLKPQDFEPATPGTQTQTDALGNVIVTAEAEPDRDDVLFGSRPNVGADPTAAGERIEAGGGHDGIFSDRPRGVADNGLGDGDWILAGAGRDIIEAGVGNDLIEAGPDGVLDGQAGGDIADGGADNDELYAESRIALAEALRAGNEAATINVMGDLLSGAGGDDWVLGDRANDLLLGGSGRDLILGGTGNDNLWGDAELIAYTRGWVVERIVSMEEARKTYTARVLGATVADSTAGAADVIYGGAGSDWIFAGTGDDFIDAGAGADVGLGEAGADILIGGTGNDVLVGDNPDSVAAADEGGDYLDGGAGDDELFGNGGSDVLIGGPGSDLLNGGPGRDIYVFNKGDGKDTVVDTLFGIDHPEAGILVLGEGFSEGNIKFRLGSLLVDLGPVDASDPGSARDEIHFEGFDQFDPFTTPVLGEIRFADGESMSYEDILAQGFDIEGTEEDDDGHDAAHPILVGTVVTDRISGFGGNDILLGAAGDDVLDGGAGSDHLQGGDGNDVLIGGEGVDVLQGEAGADTYLADFSDIINDDSGGDLVDLGVATPEELTVARFEFNGAPTLIISRSVDGDPTRGLTIVGDVTAQNLRFAFDSRELASDAFFDIAFTGSLDLAGTDGDDVLRGFGGSDTLSGFAGNDSLYGGAGNDFLEGGAGGDTYLFGRGSGLDELNDAGGDGIDRIALSSDVLPQDVTLERNIQGDLTLALSPDDRLTVIGHYADAADRIEEIHFGDGTVLTAPELDAVPLPPITGTDGSDFLVGTNFAETLVGLAGDDTLDGEGGNDVLHGGEGFDQYVFTFGMGRDIFVDDGGRVALQPGLGFNDLHAAREGNDLELMIRGTATGALLFNYFVSPQDWTIEDATGALTTPQAVLEATAQREQDWVGAQRDDYRTMVRARIASQYLSFGYELTPEGTFYSPWQDRPSSGLVSALAFWNTQTQTVTISFFNGANRTTTTTNGVTSWTNTTPSLLESTVHISEVTIVSDDPQIYASSGRTDNDEFQQVVTSVTWSGVQGDFGSISEFTSSDFILGSERNPNTGQLIASGTVTTTNVFHSFSGFVTGQVSAISPGATAQGGLFPQFINAQLTVNTITENISEVIAGPGDNEIFGGTLVDAGDGNDTVQSGGFVYGGSGDDAIEGADIAIGGPGNDRISGAIVAQGGAGDDYLEGGIGATRFVIDPVEAGIDTVSDSSGSQDAFLDRYYSSLGIFDWWGRQGVTSTRYVIIETAIFDTLEEAEAFVATMGFDSFAQAVAGGVAILTEPLPPVPANAAHDWNALAPLYATGVIDVDAVEFRQGVSAGDLSLSWGEVASTSPASGALEAYTTLDVSWGTGSLARIVIPHAEDPLGTGVEEFRFADGSVVSIQGMVAAAPPAPSFDPQDQDNVLVGSARGEVILGWAGNDTLAGGPGEDFLQGGAGDDVYVFAPGDGVDYAFDEGGADRVCFAGGISPEDMLVTTNLGGEPVFTLTTGDRLTLSNWFDETNRVESVEFADGTIWDGAQIEARMTVTPATEFDDFIGGTPADDVIDGLGGNDWIYGFGGADVLEGSAGNDLLSGGAGADVLRGGEGADALSDEQGNNFFDGGTGVDVIRAYGTPYNALGGSNFVIGGPDNDWIYSLATDNVIAFNTGDGQDTVYALYALTLSLGAGIEPSALSLSRDGADLVLAIGESDSIRLTRQYEPDPQAWPRITLQMFGSVHLYDFDTVIAEFQAALAANPSLLEFSLDGVLQAREVSVSETNAFGGALAYQYGTTGNLNELSDAAMRQALADPDFGGAPQTIQIEAANQAPMLDNPIADQIAAEDAAFGFVVPANAFSDIDLGDTLTYSASLADGSALPVWLVFDGVTGTFGGTPTNDEVGTISVKVAAIDSGNLEVFDTFDVAVASTNDAPEAVADSVAVNEDATTENLVALLLANDSDVDAGDTRRIASIDTTGTAGTVAFDPATQTLTYSADAAAQDPLAAGATATDHFSYTVADAAGATAVATVAVTLTGANDAPVLATPIADQNATGNQVFSFQVPGASFGDIDAGNALSYSATRADGSPLPGWLAFDSASRRFTGTPAASDIGAISVRVTASDPAGVSATDDFQLVVSGGGECHETDRVGSDDCDNRDHDRGKRDDERHSKRDGRKHDGRDDERSDRKGDRMADCLAAYVESKPRYDFEALARESEPPERHGELLDAREIARRWQIVGRYSSALASEHDADARGGAHYRFSDHGLFDGGALGGGLGYSGSTGMARGSANLRTLQGLEEGLQRLHA